MRHFAYATDLSGRSRQLVPGLEKRIDAEKHFAVSCPAIFRHLQPFKKWLIGWKEQGEFYRELRACA
ncbi:hypothetical protein [Desulfovibrio sp.]|uniref:hypothetical protein n=1 Tax=Desulfovibrio sp. TaxID=885 RepID=UPI0023D6FB69|nr:hypothetical protein [Desulfovibrio sp.]MDE7240483.1 hypothetical protein [Desulfovibrio sp.]